MKEVDLRPFGRAKVNKKNHFLRSGMKKSPPGGKYSYLCPEKT